MTKIYFEILEFILKDQTSQKNIIWATNDYESLGEFYSYEKQILPQLIIENNKIIISRMQKNENLQQKRKINRAEISTPLWLCNNQNNLIDKSWFEKENIFNFEKKIKFPKGKNWKDYINETKIEIACGEAPYITSRYNTLTGDFIPIPERIGILDRKLRIINENCKNSEEWFENCLIAFQNIYGFEISGDSLFLARKNLIYSFIENFIFKFQKNPPLDYIKQIAFIISWNFWQMDGLKENSCLIKNWKNKKNIIWNSEGKNRVDFNAVIGNPPYMQMDGGFQVSAKPIYPHFVEIAKKIKPRYISMVIPSRWFSGGKGLDQFRKSMLEDKKISILHDYLNPEKVFPKTNIRGGICYFLRDEKHKEEELTQVVTFQKNQKPVSIKRSLKTENVDIFIRHGISLSILNKIIQDKNFISFEKNVSPRKPFGLESSFIKNEQFKKSEKNIISPLKCYGKGGKIGFVEEKNFNFKPELVNAYKIFTPYANNIGTELNDDNLNTFIGHPKTICTETYILLGFNLNLNKKTSLYLKKYLTTKFVRFLHSLAKTSQHGTSKTYKFVPLQNFSSISDIDWTKSILEIENQLYKKYKLKNDEITFIEKTIKPMT